MRQRMILKDQNTGTIQHELYRERRFHARGVYPTQYTSRMVTASVKQEEEIDTRHNNNARE